MLQEFKSRGECTEQLTTRAPFTPAKGEKGERGVSGGQRERDEALFGGSVVVGRGGGGGLRDAPPRQHRGHWRRSCKDASAPHGAHFGKIDLAPEF